MPFRAIAGRHLVVEEKLDGANAGISFDSGGVLKLQSRGHFLAGGPRERQFAPLKAWAATHQGVLWERLGTRYVLYGEWLYAKHTVFYDALPHHFCEFDLLDRSSGEFLSTPERRRVLMRHAGGVRAGAARGAVAPVEKPDRVDRPVPVSHVGVA